VVYNISFDFILNIFSKPEEDVALADVPFAAPHKIVTKVIVPEFKDDSENIFAKDNLTDLSNQVMNEPLNLEVETIEEEQEMKLFNLETGKEINLDEEVADGDLKLEVEEVVEEAMAQPVMGRIGTNYDPTLDLSDYKFPSLDLLEEHGSDKVKIDAEELERNKNQIISTLNNYQIEISKIKAHNRAYRNAV
jgi:hypothetical protein